MQTFRAPGAVSKLCLVGNQALRVQINLLCGPAAPTPTCLYAVCFCHSASIAQILGNMLISILRARWEDWYCSTLISEVWWNMKLQPAAGLSHATFPLRHGFTWLDLLFWPSISKSTSVEVPSEVSLYQKVVKTLQTTDWAEIIFTRHNSYGDQLAARNGGFVQLPGRLVHVCAAP